MIILLIYIAIFVAAFFAVQFVNSRMDASRDFTSLKTVTFGDESAVTPNRAASFISVIAIFLIWAAFTGSKLTPIHAPGPFVGDSSFSYTVETSDGQTDDAEVSFRVFRVGQEVEALEVDPGDGFAKNDSDIVGAWRSKLIRVDANDEIGREEGAAIVAVDGQAIAPGEEVSVASGIVSMTSKGTLNYKPAKGWQMEPIWLPSPEAVLGPACQHLERRVPEFDAFRAPRVLTFPRCCWLCLRRTRRYPTWLCDGSLRLVPWLV